MLMSRFKAETQHLHQQLSQQRSATDMLSNTITREEYVGFLARFCGIYQPLETLIMAAPEWQHVDFDARARCKAHHLYSDLVTLGYTPEDFRTLPLCTDLPTIQHFAHVIGCMYVLEGSTLGGQLITRHMRSRFGFDETHGCRFFSSYGAQLGPMWKAFGAFVETQAHDQAFCDAAVAAASDTFIKIGAWLNQPDSRRGGVTTVPIVASISSASAALSVPAA
jgi:heme oxygenase (biliverdin-IX-beta and delta-forming)